MVLLFSCNGTESTNHAAKDTVASLKWVDYREGELPPIGYYSALDSVIKKWGIRYERIEGGCEVVPGQKQRHERNNKKYFGLLEKKFGKDWRERFDEEVSTLDSLLLKNQGLNKQTR